MNISYHTSIVKVYYQSSKLFVFNLITQLIKKLNFYIQFNSQKKLTKQASDH